MKSPGRILVVDDDKATRFLCSEALGVAGYKVDAAPDGNQALKKFEDATYSLIISDLEMPGLHGFEFYEQALRDFPYLEDRFIFITGNTSNSAISRLNDMKVRYFLKPFRTTDLVRAAVDLIETKARDTADKRTEKRVQVQLECSLLEEGSPEQRFLHGQTNDISRSGVKVKFGGAAPLKPATYVNFFVEINKLPIVRHAKVIWSSLQEKGNQVSAGLRFAEPIPSVLLATP